ncbi:MAG: hypothetical protein EBT89_05880, partial [Opitutaceae bacterium]|nr:hypothetical protein [Opitutaceae bacterium]
MLLNTIALHRDNLAKPQQAHLLLPNNYPMQIPFPRWTAPLASLLVITLTLLTGLRAADPASPMTDNPLLTESPLPFQYPQFDKIKNEHFAPGFALGMADHLKEIESIANNSSAPTFENTIVALERAGELLSRVSAIFGNLASCNTNPELQKLQRTLSPQLAAHSDAIRLNPILFARIEALYTARETLGLDAESQRVLWRYYKDFVRAGAKLAPADKEKLKALNSQLATLQTNFTQNTLKEVAASAVWIDTREELSGFSEAEITAAAAAAKAEGHAGKYK